MVRVQRNNSTSSVDDNVEDEMRGAGRKPRPRPATAKSVSCKSVVGEKRARKLLPLLQALKGMKPHQRNEIVGHLDQEGCDMLYETIRNVLYGTLLNDDQGRKLAKRLRPHTSSLRYLSKMSHSPKIKKQRLKQYGGNILLPILSAAIPLLIDLVRK